MIGPHCELLSHITSLAEVDCKDRVACQCQYETEQRSRTSTHDIEVRLDGKRVQRLDVSATFGHAMHYPV